MPYQVTWEKKGVVINTSGVFTAREMCELSQIVHGDERFDSLKYQLLNCLDQQKMDISIDDVVKRANLDKAAAKTNPNMQVAIVVDEEDAQALTSLYECEVDGKWQVRQFTNLIEARQWLDKDHAVN